MIVTPRLRIVPCDAALLDAAANDRTKLAVLCGAPAHEQWPGPDLAGALPLMLAAARGDATLTGWLAWLVVVEEEIVGDAGTHGKPDVNGIVEIGFSVVPALRSRGIAFEAARAICDHLASLPEVKMITARTTVDNEHSIRILEKLGMHLVAEDGEHLRYEMTP